MRRLLLVFALLVGPIPPVRAQAVDLDTATLAELEALPGVGPAKAQAILDVRAQRGPFATVDDLLSVPGIGPATLVNIRHAVRVGARGEPRPLPAGGRLPTATGPSVATVDVNAATAAELTTLPGIGPAKAAAILADRERHGPYRSCHELTRVVGIGPATVANLAGRCVTGP